MFQIKTSGLMGYSATASVIPSTSALLPSHNRRQSLSSTLQTHFTRRPLLLLSTALSLPPSPSSAIAAAPPPPPPPPPPDTTITDRVFLDFSLCPTSFSPGRAQDPYPCPDPQPMGRLILGLYGKLLPLTVSNFKAMCTGSSGSSYKGTLVQKIFPGQYFLAGRQGRRDKGEVPRPVDLARNKETVDYRAFVLPHSRPGLVSLCLSENDDDDEIKLDPNYHNVEFLITTGPGPCPQLDSKNIVFGTVVEGLDVVTAIASIPTYKPAERIRQFNELAEFLGDERAQTARAIWNRPIETVYISDSGELKVAKPSLSPSLP
ncbi:peptidyl-prolyl cis-trans isomerase CYP28, chloroplastic [Malania oleifera]|uniref:peptidyl-prolyl cis-trans isomerase CYP28, chloroplastic n=1 Tax=Malania oleifera TaxID=397392 RepID=UPI0025ADD844|nr:peptidyl-prolyl cis-trans isomerase CYP28, chloroplastic [Malania oleifera]